jgi:ABC-type Fe3+ transport system substrate-binding protein
MWTAMALMGCRRTTLSLIVLLALLPLSALRAETLDELYEKAKAEKSLVFYTGAGAAAAKAMTEAFEKRFPGIAVTGKGNFSNVLDSEIDQQLKDKKVTTDFVQFQTVQDYRRWDKAGALIHFKPEGFDQVLAPMKDKNGAWVAVTATPMFYGYNSEKMQEADVPKSALDFLKPQFRGKVVTVYPTDDDATLYNFDLIVRKYGWDYMKKYIANDPYFIQGHRDVAARVRSGESFLSFDITQRGGNLKVAMSQADKTPVFFTAGGILKDAPHPNAAKLLLTWMLSKERHNPAAYSPRADMPPPAGMPALTDARFAIGYADFLGDGRRLPALRKRFGVFVGPVVNKATQ